MIFIDTSAFLAIENIRDAHHARALAVRDACLAEAVQFVTSDYVLDESYTIIRRRAGHAAAVGFGEAVRSSRAVRVQHLTTGLLDSAWAIFRRYADHDFSFTDCSSFAVMRHGGIRRAFTFDSDFRALGWFDVHP